GLGEGSALPVGVPVPWPSATPPTGWLKCNGAPFSAEEYPELAKAYPTNKLPDLRSEFIRGWDDGRGIDIGRAILGSQSDALQNHLHFITTMGPEGPGGGNATSPTDDTGRLGGADSWLVGAGNWTTYGPPSGRVAEETRPRNIAFNYIVRAV
ncbi:phage tail protein, partial [Escherichia coli]